MRHTCDRLGRGLAARVVGDAGISIEPREPIGWAQAMQRVWHDEPYRAELRERGLHQSKKFTWLETARQTAATYQQII